MHRFCSLLLGISLAVATGSVSAAENAPIVVASLEQPRFIPLNKSRVAGVRVSTPMRSDRTALRNGFMRLDRTMLHPAASTAKVLTLPPAAKKETLAKRAPVTVTRPQDNAVLDLFGTSAAPAAAPLAAGRVAHAWPLPPSAKQTFTSGFGARKDPFSGKPGFHGGVDIAAAVGTPVLASADGVVTKVENGARYGKYISVKHRDGTESSYGHLSAQSVRVGQQVRQGQQLGALGSTGRSTGPHLDYRISRGGQLFNPMTVLRQPAITGTRQVAQNSRRTSRVSMVNGVKIIR